MRHVAFFKVKALPDVPLADAFYWLLDPNGGRATGYLTSSTGEYVPIDSVDVDEGPPGPPGEPGPRGPAGPRGEDANGDEIDPGDLTLIFANKLI